jgi:hypothetical protein
MDFLQMQGTGTVTIDMPTCLTLQRAALLTRSLLITAKLQQVTQLLKSLEKDLQDNNLTTAGRTKLMQLIYMTCYWILTTFSLKEKVQTLLQLRQHGTNPTNAGPIYSQNVWDLTGYTCRI